MVVIWQGEQFYECYLTNRNLDLAVDLETDDLVQAKKETILYSMAKNAGIAAYFSYLILSCLNRAQIFFQKL